MWLRENLKFVRHSRIEEPYWRGSTSAPTTSLTRKQAHLVYYQVVQQYVSL